MQFYVTCRSDNNAKGCLSLSLMLASILLYVLCILHAYVLYTQWWCTMVAIYRILTGHLSDTCNWPFIYSLYYVGCCTYIYIYSNYTWHPPSSNKKNNLYAISEYGYSWYYMPNTISVHVCDAICNCLHCFFLLADIKYKPTRSWFTKV